MTDPRLPPAPRLRVVTREIDPLEDVLSYTSPSHPTYWNRRGDVMAALGETTSFIGAGGPAEAGFADWWRAVAADAEIDDPIGLPGTGLIAFGSFGRVFLGGEERDIMAGYGAAVAAIEGLSGRVEEQGKRE